ncbi:phage recombination protein Bet [Methylicorpusculum oleiharenae]|uniref:phage recombination protein Bet n=1 Tax=Methylicorpusculum oleiharenae TaxID=1338687 RepID=UPI001358D75A|nr:phage recombination protein Bet [Methylicorpusculum oleiharenae]
MTVSKQSLFKKFADKFNFTDEKKLTDTLKATAFKVKDGEVTDEQMTALLIVADQYGLNPFTKEIFAYPDKQNGIVPVVSVDGWSRIINQHPDMDGLEFVYDSTWITDLPGAKPCPASIECVIYRKGRTHPVRIKEFLDEVYRPPFQGTKNNQPYSISGPWQSHTKRLLRHKALIQCSRIAFGFTGIYDQDEADRIIEGQAEVIINPASDPSDNAKRILPKLIKRASENASWQAAIDYAGENFAGIDLNFITQELNKAKAAAEAVLLDAQNETQLPLEQGDSAPHEKTMPPSGATDPKKPNSQHFTKAREALS